MLHATAPTGSATAGRQRPAAARGRHRLCTNLRTHGLPAHPSHSSRWLAQPHTQQQPHSTATSGPARCPAAAAAMGAPASHSSAGAAPPLQVTRTNFKQALPAIQEALAGCQFYAFDCEMTGLRLQGQDDWFLDDPEERYARTKAAAEQFLVTQFGLCTFTWTGAGYSARSFNIALFPLPWEDLDARFTCQASALVFLVNQGFDFNKMVREGVPFLPLNERDRRLAALAQQHQAAKVAPVSLSDLDDDEAGYASLLSDAITSWLEGNSPLLHLPPAPPAYTRLQQQVVSAGLCNQRGVASRYIVLGPQDDLEQYLPPGTSSSSSSSSGGATGHPSGGPTLLRATPQQVSAAAASALQQQRARVQDAAGFSTLLEVLRDSGKPAVGHNLRYDLIFLLQQCLGELPGSWEEFKGLARSWFPGGLYDTKYLAYQVKAEAAGNTSLLRNTTLGGLYTALVEQWGPGTAAAAAAQAAAAARGVSPGDEGGDGSDGAAGGGGDSSSAALQEWLAGVVRLVPNPGAFLVPPVIAHAPGCEAYDHSAAPTTTTTTTTSSSSSSSALQQGSLEHEAGYDAFLTAAVFSRLLQLLELQSFSTRSRWLLPTAPVLPPPLTAAADFGGRLYLGGGWDFPHVSLTDQDPTPARPAVLVINSGGRKFYEIQNTLRQLGFGRVGVHMVRQGQAAYVALGTPERVQQALSALKAKRRNWEVMSYADWQYKWNTAAAAAAASSAADADAGSSSSSRGGLRWRAVPSTVQPQQQQQAGGAGAAAVGQSLLQQQQQRRQQQSPSSSQEEEDVVQPPSSAQATTTNGRSSGSSSSSRQQGRSPASSSSSSSKASPAASLPPAAGAGNGAGPGTSSSTQTPQTDQQQQPQKQDQQQQAQQPGGSAPSQPEAGGKAQQHIEAAEAAAPSSVPVSTAGASGAGAPVAKRLQAADRVGGKRSGLGPKPARPSLPRTRAVLSE